MPPSEFKKATHVVSRMALASPSNSRSPHGPKFFVRLQESLAQSLKEIEDAKPSSIKRDLMRLDLYRNVFQELASQLKTYGTFLDRIRLEYERRLQYLEKRLACAESDRTRLQNDFKELQTSLLEQVDPMSAGRVGFIESGGKEDSGHSKALEAMRQRARYAHALTKLERMEKEKHELLESLAKIEAVKMELDQKLENEQAAKTLMFHEYAELQTELSWYKEAQKNQEDPGVLRLALNQSRKDLSKVQGLLNDYTFGFDSIIPQSQYDTLMKKYENLALEFDRLDAKAKYLSKENGDLVSYLREMSVELEKLRTDGKHSNAEDQIHIQGHDF
ncbi:uncharacterized protein LOC131877406 [Tigriopus californicus]|uniref:uncharacterized protein LOC131877406 n=1 Tax=Tigriopus californicus TaxID=6832 RepID=UPI0027DAB389|nr:uncharacterized protein LOC131877406 [Tigriopus californicus]